MDAAETKPGLRVASASLCRHFASLPVLRRTPSENHPLSFFFFYFSQPIVDRSIAHSTADSLLSPSTTSQTNPQSRLPMPRAVSPAPTPSSEVGASVAVHEAAKAPTAQ